MEMRHLMWTKLDISFSYVNATFLAHEMLFWTLEIIVHKNWNGSDEAEVCLNQRPRGSTRDYSNADIEPWPEVMASANCCDSMACGRCPAPKSLKRAELTLAQLSECRAVAALALAAFPIWPPNTCFPRRSFDCQGLVLICFCETSNGLCSLPNYMGKLQHCSASRLQTGFKPQKKKLKRNFTDALAFEIQFEQHLDGAKLSLPHNSLSCDALGWTYYSLFCAQFCGSMFLAQAKAKIDSTKIGMHQLETKITNLRKIASNQINLSPTSNWVRRI